MQSSLIMRGGVARKAVFLVSTVLFFGGAVFAKDETPAAVKVDMEAMLSEKIATMSVGSLLSESAKVLVKGDFEGALPYLEAYLERMADDENPRALNLKQEVRLKIGRIRIQLGERYEGQEFLDQYLENKPLYKRREALKVSSVNLYKLGMEIKDTDPEEAVFYFEDSISAVTNAFYDPPLDELIAKNGKKETSAEEMTEEQLGGMTKRQVKRMMEYAKGPKKDSLKGVVAASGPEMDAEYTVEDRVVLNMTLAEACAELERWGQCLEAYRYVIENSENSSHVGYATMKMVNALVSLKKYDEAGEFIVDLCRTDARYDIRVNLALMKVATVLQEAKEYDSALTLFRMILPRGDLVVHQESRMNDIRVDAGMPEIEVTVVTNKAGGFSAVFGNKSSDLDVSVGSGSVFGSSVEIPPALKELENAVNQVISLQPYEDDVRYRVGQLYGKSGRPWEAFSVLNVVYEKDPYGQLGQQAFFESLQVLVDPLKEYERVETVGYEYLGIYKEGLFPRQVAVALGSSYMKQRKYKDLKKLIPYIEAFEPGADNARAVRQYDCELQYVMAVSDMMALDYKAAEAGFAKLLKEFPGSHQEGNAMYWHALSLLFLQRYDESFAGFEAYPEKFPKGRRIPECSFRSGICLYSMEKYAEALERFTHVIKTWPDQSLYSDACSLRGDLYASGFREDPEDIERALADYREAIRSAGKSNVQQGTYPVFQMLGVFEVLGRHDEIYKTIDEYEVKWGEKADVAKAAYWRGKTKMDQGLVEEAMEAYHSTVVKHGASVKQDGVDLIINEMVNVARGMEDDELVRLRERIQKSIDAAEQKTLRLRLRCLLAQIDKKEVELGKALIADLDDFGKAPPPVLSVICKASFEAEDYSRSEEILKIFQDKFEDSEYMRAAFKLRATGLFKEGKTDEAMKIVQETQDIYGYAYDAAWAQLMRGRIELEKGSFLSARDSFRTMLDIRDWRGEAFAEALYWLGLAEEKNGNFKTAFEWYQRDYIQYKGYAGGQWAAESYLASARCLGELGFADKQRDTYRAMLFDKYVNKLPQADKARGALGSTGVSEVETILASGVTSNITVTIDAEVTQ